MNMIKTKTYNGKLYRANERSFTVFGRASDNYKGAPMKYFTLNKNETTTYTRYGKPYVKTWLVIDELELVDILNLDTRRALEGIPQLKESLDISFPIINNKVSRVSEEVSKHHDDIVLRILCNLGYDGYIMKRITNNSKNNNYIFHSEVGLCPKAFHKLELEKSELKAAPTRKNNNRGSKKSKSRLTRRNNNNNNGMYFYRR